MHSPTDLKRELKKTDVEGLYKECDGIVINKDTEALEKYKKTKGQLRKMRELQKTVVTMQEEMTEIKSLLKEFLSR